MPKTTTVLTIELPGELGDRLRSFLRRRRDQSLREIAIEALEEWLERRATIERRVRDVPVSLETAPD